MAEGSAVGVEIKAAGRVDLDTHNLSTSYLPMTPINTTKRLINKTKCC